VRSATIWFEPLRLATSIITGRVTASVIPRKLAAYPRQNGLAHALRELAKLERTLFTLDWQQDPERCFSIDLARFATVPMKTSFIVPAA
jgi:TnpA family transposase